MKKNILFYIAMNLILLTLTACGGGGGGSNVSTGATAKTTATLTLNLTGTPPAGSNIAGAFFTLDLPANVTPANTGGVVAIGVVSCTGTFSGGTVAVVYKPATVGVPGKLDVTLASSTPGGVATAGEVSKITLQLSNGAEPSLGNFGLSAVGVGNLAGSPISGMGVSIGNLTLQ